MAKKREDPPPAPGAPAWTATMCDLMTNVLCFFVLLFAMSTVDAAKFQQIAASFNSNFGILQSGRTIGQDQMLGNGIAQLPNIERSINNSKENVNAQDQVDELQKMASSFKTYFAENNLQDKIQIKESAESVVLTFKDSVLYDSGQAILKPEALQILDTLSVELLKYPDNDIKIEGHADNRPISTAQFPSNWELSGARAIAVTRYFVESKGFSPYRMSSEGFGEYRPVDTNDTPEGRARNRRVEIKIMSKYQSGGGAQQGIY